MDELLLLGPHSVVTGVFHIDGSSSISIKFHQVNYLRFQICHRMQACRRLGTLSPLLRQVYYNKRTFATINPLKPEIYDVVCVGGGPAGLSLVNALRMDTAPQPLPASTDIYIYIGASKSTSHLKIALIESQELGKNVGPRHTSQDAYSNRCSSLTPTSVRFLQGDYHALQIPSSKNVKLKYFARHWSMGPH